MNASWKGRHWGLSRFLGSFALHDPESPSCRLGHGPIGDPECIEDLRVVEQGNSALDPVGGDARGPVATRPFPDASLGEVGELRLVLNPVAVLGDETPELGLASAPSASWPRSIESSTPSIGAGRPARPRPGNPAGPHRSADCPLSTIASVATLWPTANSKASRY